jgi:WD40-like Beta Propeller Repeat
MTTTRHRRVLGVATALLLGTGLLLPAAAAVPDRDPAAAAASAAKPGAGRIVYVCGADLCAVDPDSGRTVQLTTDAGGYARPSVSADGSRIAAVKGQSLVAGAYGSNLPEVWAQTVRGINDVAISPDGTGVAASHWYTEVALEYRYTCGGLCMVVKHFDSSEYWSAPGAPPAGHPGSAGVGFLGSSLLSTDSEIGTYDSTTGSYVGGQEQICVVATPSDADAACEVRYSEPKIAPSGRDTNLTDPTASADGRLVAAVVGTVPETSGALADNPTGESPVVRVYDAATGARTTEIPGNGFSPSFSPDGTQLVYQGLDDHLYVVASSGGTPTRLVAGRHPSWGAGSVTYGAPGTADPTSPGPGAAGVSIKALSVSRTSRRLPLRVSCPAGPCVGKVTVRSAAKVRLPGARRKARVTLARGSYRVGDGREKVVRLTLTKVGRSMVRTRKKTRAVATVRATSPGRSTGSARVVLLRR